MAFVNEKTEDGKWQTIDKERRAVLTKVSGPGIEGRYDCEFVWMGHVVKLAGYPARKIHGNPERGESYQYEMNWRFPQVYMPPALYQRKEEALKLIAEALEVYGDNHETHNAYSVSVEFLNI